MTKIEEMLEIFRKKSGFSKEGGIRYGIDGPHFSYDDFRKAFINGEITVEEAVGAFRKGLQKLVEDWEEEEFRSLWQK